MYKLDNLLELDCKHTVYSLNYLNTKWTLYCVMLDLYM